MPPEESRVARSSALNPPEDSMTDFKYMNAHEMRDELDALRARQRRLLGQAGDIADRAKAEDRSLTDGEEEKVSGLSRAVDKINDEIAEGEMALAEYERQQALVLKLAQNPNNVEHGWDRLASPDRSTGARDSGMRVLERRSDVLSSEALDNLDDLIRNRDPLGVDARYLAAVGDPAYGTAFHKILRDPQHGHLRHSPAEVAAMQRVEAVEQERGMVGGTGSAGGFALPIEIDPSVLLSSAGELNPVRTVARVQTIGSREWRGVSSAGVVASYDPEASEVSDDTPTLAQPTTITASGRAFVPFSIELGDDWASLAGELAKLVSDARDVLDSDKFLNGSGTDEPHGIYTGLAVGQRVQSVAATINTVGVYALKAGLPSRFTVNGTFAFHPTRLDNIYKSVGGGSSEPPLLVTREGALIGRPKIEWTALNASTASIGTRVGLYGDFQNFLVADRLGMRAEIVSHLFGAGRRPTGERGFFCMWRTATKVLVANAFRYLEIS
jgi:HK97 family phage major capsid protein